MVIKDLINIIYDNIVIYKGDIEYEFVDIYKGTFNEIPSEMLSLNVRSIGAKRKGIIDIHVN